MVSGLTEVAFGAMLGWPYALAIADSERAQKLGIRSKARLRQWHLDHIMLGGLATLIGIAVPGMDRRVSLPLGVGAWTNALAFGVLTVRPDLQGHPVYRGAVTGSFVLTSTGFVGTAAEAHRRWRDS